MDDLKSRLAVEEEREMSSDPWDHGFGGFLWS
jgi:hypothetical protein